MAALIPEAVGIDYVGESKVLTPPMMSCISFVCGCHDLSEALRKVREGAP